MLNGPVSDIHLSSNFSAAFPGLPFGAYNFCMVPAHVSFCLGWVHHLQTGQGWTLNQACSPSFHKLCSIPLLKNFVSLLQAFYAMRTFLAHSLWGAKSFCTTFSSSSQDFFMAAKPLSSCSAISGCSSSAL